MGAICARCVALLMTVWGLTAQADEVDLSDKIAIELNTVAEGQGSCTLTFLVTNGHTVDIEQLVYETELFDAGGSVDRLTLELCLWPGHACANLRCLIWHAAIWDAFCSMDCIFARRRGWTRPSARQVWCHQAAFRSRFLADAGSGSFAIARAF